MASGNDHYFRFKSRIPGTKKKNVIYTERTWILVIEAAAVVMGEARWVKGNQSAVRFLYKNIYLKTHWERMAIKVDLGMGKNDCEDTGYFQVKEGIS